MLDMWERWIQFHELNIKREPEHAPPIEFDKLVPLLINRWEKGDSVKLINKESAALRILDIKNDKRKKVTILLVQYTDKNVTDPVFSDLQTGKLRTEPKLDGEGIAVSAHVVISHTPLNGNKETYRLLLEEIPGLGRSNLSPFLKSEFKAACENVFEFNDEESGKPKKFSPAVEILGDLSANLADDLKTGILQGIELIKHKKGKSGFDEEKYFVESSSHLKIIPVITKGEGVIEVVKKVMSFAKEKNYDDVKIRYKRSQGKQKTATMGSTKEDIADALIVRDEMIRSDEVLGQCLPKISEKFSKKMIAMLE